jgi:hypothetical protein
MGSNLKKRIDAILANRRVHRLNWAKRLVLTGAGITSIAAPLAVGVMNAPFIRAQPTPIHGASAEPANPQQQALSSPSDRFEVVSVKPSPRLGPGADSSGCQGGPSTSDPGLFHCTLIDVSNLISMAFSLEGYRFPG